MSARPGVRRKDESLRVGAIALDQRHRDRKGEISGKQGNTLRRVHGPNFAEGFKETMGVRKRLMSRRSADR
jgi:hypothetical protein